MEIYFSVLKGHTVSRLQWPRGLEECSQARTLSPSHFSSAFAQGVGCVCRVEAESL